ncbi:MAG: DUF4325 domain-containing protein [Candidatus Magasanikbacteria bacterium]
MTKEKTTTIKIFDYAGKFAENKDKAQHIREKLTRPNLEKGNSIIYDYSGVDSTTQSFTHALISDHIRNFGKEVLDRLYFKNCSETVKKIIELVTEYMQRKIK